MRPIPSPVGTRDDVDGRGCRARDVPAGRGLVYAAIEFADGRKATITGFAHGSPFLTNVEMETGAKLIEVKVGLFPSLHRAHGGVLPRSAIGRAARGNPADYGRARRGAKGHWPRRVHGCGCDTENKTVAGSKILSLPFYLAIFGFKMRCEAIRMITIDNVIKIYTRERHITALIRPINLSIPTGSVVGFLGSNGAGKILSPSSTMTALGPFLAGLTFSFTIIPQRSSCRWWCAAGFRIRGCPSSPPDIAASRVAIGIHDGGKVRRDLKESGDGLIARDAFGASYIGTTAEVLLVLGLRFYQQTF